MNVLITGGSGFLGRALTQALKGNGLNHGPVQVTWVSRAPHQQTSAGSTQRTEGPDQVISYTDLATTATHFDIIVNLAGAGIADQRWTAARKRELYDSRLQPTQAILDYIARIDSKPELLISGSAIGWYGVQSPQDRTGMDETYPLANVRPDFAHQLCQDWEQLARQANPQVAVAIIRTGIVIAADGGMIARLKTPFSLGLGGKLGSGQQIMSWISREDWVRAVCFIIEQQLATPDTAASLYNLTAPIPVTNAEFTEIIGSWLHRPTLMAMPAMAAKTLFGEMSTLLLDGQRVVPQRLIDENFSFSHPQLLEALKSPH